MNSRSARSLHAAERVRQIGVDDAKRVLSDAIYVANSARRKVESLQSQAAAADAHALSLLRAPGVMDPGSLLSAQRYRVWQHAQLAAARQLLSREELAEADARAAFGARLRDRDAVRRLQERRRREEREWLARREQHVLDDLGATRALAARITDNPSSGERNGR
jgi:flagellar export protein FliJ